MRIKSLSDATGCEILAKAEVKGPLFFFKVQMDTLHHPAACRKINIFL